MEKAVVKACHISDHAYSCPDIEVITDIEPPVQNCEIEQHQLIVENHSQNDVEIEDHEEQPNDEDRMVCNNCILYQQENTKLNRKV